MKLASLSPSDTAKVLKILCDKKTKNRLFKMGLTEGVTVTLVRRAPLGDPLELKVRDFYLAIRSSAAEKIEVEKLSPQNGKKTARKTTEMSGNLAEES